MEETRGRGNAAFTYKENIFLKQGYSKNVNLRILAEDKRVNLSYQNVKKYGTIQQGSSKVMIVGDHGVGKTSLIKHLMEEPFQQNEPSTKSVQMYDVETVTVDKNWNRIPDNCNEYERVLNACAACAYQQLPENPTLLEKDVQVPRANKFNSTRKAELCQLADVNQNGIENVKADSLPGCEIIKAYDNSKFKSASTNMKIALISLPFLFLFGGFPSNFALIHMIYVTLYCFQYKDLSISHGYIFGQACAIIYFFVQNVTIQWGIIESERNLISSEGILAIFVMSLYGLVSGMLIGSGCGNGFVIACALVFSPTNHMYLTSLPDVQHMFSAKRLTDLFTIAIGVTLGGGAYHLKEYHLSAVKLDTVLLFITCYTLHFCDVDIFNGFFLELQNFTVNFSMILYRVVCGIVFGTFCLTGLINYGRKLITYTGYIHRCPRMTLGLLLGIVLAKFTGAELVTFSYNQLVDVLLAILPIIFFDIHGFSQVYTHEFNLKGFRSSLLRLECGEEIVPLRIHLVDFAGEKEYQTSHQAFLAKGAIYIVTFNLENSICNQEIALNKIKYWLNSILMYVGTGQSVFLVGTHKDKVNEEDVESFQKWLSHKICETAYYEQFSFTFPRDNQKEGVFFVVKNPEKLSKDAEARLLRNKISKLAKSPLLKKNMNMKAMDQNTKPIPLSWFHLLDVKQNLGVRRFIRKSELFNILLEQDEQLTEEEFAKMLKYFNDRGDIRYDDSCDSLKDIVVLHSQLFRDTIVELVSRAMALQTNAKLQLKGIITSDVLDAAIRTDNREEKQFIKDLLEANDLILPLRNSDGKTDCMLSGFLPELNERDDNPQMKLTENIYYFDFGGFWPEKLFLKFIVKCKENSKETDEHKDPAYKPVIYKNAASFIQLCGKNEIPYNIRIVQKSTSQNLIQICIGTVSDGLQYYILERLNSWIEDIVKQSQKPYYQLGFPYDADGNCAQKEGENHIHLYQLADSKHGFRTGKQVSLVCQCTRGITHRDILPAQLSTKGSGGHSSENFKFSELLSDSFLHELANKMGSDKFELLGSKLGISYQRLREYPADFAGKSDIVRQCNLKMLHEWKENNEGTDKVQLVKELVQCLTECELRELAAATEDLIKD